MSDLASEIAASILEDYSVGYFCNSCSGTEFDPIKTDELILVIRYAISEYERSRLFAINAADIALKKAMAERGF